MSERNYRIRIKKGEIEIEVEGDKQFVLDEIQKLLEKELGEIPSISIGKEEEKFKKVSLVEFLNSKNLTTHYDRVITVAYYLTHYEKMGNFNSKDIENCYLNARISKPANISDIINGNVAKGYLMEAGEKDGLKAFTTTQTGDQYVESELNL